MYLEHFGFREKPFNNTPDPRFLFLSKNHREIFAHLLYGVEDRLGFIEVTGEVGTGKTTVLRTLLGQMEEDRFRVALLFNPTMGPDELLDSIAREFALDICREPGAASVLEQLNEFFLSENAAGRILLLVIDEAQTLKAEVLEKIRLLSNLETDSSKLLQILLVGQPELGLLLATPGLRQLNQRIAVRYHLGPMDASDSFAYVRHRLALASDCPSELFAASALKRIYRITAGYPRHINVLCERALVVAFSEGASLIDASMVKRAHRELSRPSGPQPLRPKLLAFVVLLMLALVVLWGYLPARQAKVESSPLRMVKVPESPMQSRPPVDMRRLEVLRDEMAQIDEAASLSFAFDSLCELWGVKLPENKRFSLSGSALPRELKSRKLEWTRFQGNGEQLFDLEIPAVLEFSLPGVRGKRYLLLSHQQENAYVVKGPAGQSWNLGLQELKVLWFGKGYVMWRNHLGLAPLDHPGKTGASVTQLQQALGTLGYEVGARGVFDSGTIQALTRFQRDRGLSPDGRVGPRTLLHLNRAIYAAGEPRLGDGL